MCLSKTAPSVRWEKDQLEVSSKHRARLMHVPETFKLLYEGKPWTKSSTRHSGNLFCHFVVTTYRSSVVMSLCVFICFMVCPHVILFLHVIIISLLCYATLFPGSFLYFKKVPWLRLVTCLLDFCRFQKNN